MSVAIGTRHFLLSTTWCFRVGRCLSIHWLNLHHQHTNHWHKPTEWCLSKLFHLTTDQGSPHLTIDLWCSVRVIRRITTKSTDNRVSSSESFVTPNVLYMVRRHKSSRFDAEGLPEITESDLEETFTHGHGPGGQSVNKTTNCCVLRHIPTGVTVKVHETRSLHENRQYARLRLRQKLDLFYNGENSKREMEKRQNSLQKKEKKRKTNVRLEKLKAFKDREGLT